MKKAGVVSRETKERILNSAKNEFAEKGYQYSSLRSIATSAGVTTGAIYFFFKGKDDLFDEVVSEIMAPLKEFVLKHFAEEKLCINKNPLGDAEMDVKFAEFLKDSYKDNASTWKILVSHINHPVVQKYIKDYVNTATEHYIYMLESASKIYSKAVIGGKIGVHTFVNMQMHAFLTMASHNIPEEKLFKNIKMVIRMLRGAFCTLLED